MIFFNLASLDWLAIILFLAFLGFFNFRVERETASPPSTYALMVKYRAKWMQVLTTRDNRIVDAQILGLLQQSSRYFASGMAIAIGAVTTLISRPDLQHEFELMFHHEISHTAWSVKLFFTVLVLASGFFNFLWSGRLFGYCAIVMAAIPEDQETDETMKEAHRAARINVAAAKSFNRGTRKIYFALASLCWLLGAVPFIIAIFVVVSVIWRREFMSQSRTALMEGL